jgi:carboxymethylenebutenolidase
MVSVQQHKPPYQNEGRRRAVSFLCSAAKGNRPAVIFYMDAIGIRPALCDMAARLASNGGYYHVLLPNLYYRSGPSKPFDAATVFKGGAERTG